LLTDETRIAPRDCHNNGRCLLSIVTLIVAIILLLLLIALITSSSASSCSWRSWGLRTDCGGGAGDPAAAQGGDGSVPRC
jgi:hypothetical protein